MPLVNVMVNGRAYTIACDEGEDEHLKELAAHVDAKVKELAGSVGQVGDQKMILMAALLITDELFEARGRLETHERRSGELANTHADLANRVGEVERRATRAIEETDRRAGQSLDDAAKRLERIVAELNAA